MDDDIQFKTKKFPSKKMITISPLERNNLLNNSFCQTATNIDTIVNEEPHQSPRLNSHTLNEFSLRKKDILLVDDEDFNLITLQSCLKAERLLADTASNGEEGIQKIKENVKTVSKEEAGVESWEGYLQKELERIFLS